MPVLTVMSLADDPNLHTRLEDLYGRGWPAFMAADPVDIECWPPLLELAPHLQLAMLEDDRVVATAHATPLCWDPSQPLPPEGWDWAFTAGIADLRAGRPTTAACALAITIEPDRRGEGLGVAMLLALRDRVRESGGRWLLGPLRPSHKSAEPDVPFAPYIARRRPDGLPGDPWLRAHVKVGARVGELCERSMTVRAPLAQWEAWSGIAYQPGQPYVIPSALIPIEVDGDEGTYVEPNIWVIHDL
jgi:GNAT superfamily N-acetyltransferase